MGDWSGVTGAVPLYFDGISFICCCGSDCGWDNVSVDIAGNVVGSNISLHAMSAKESIHRSLEHTTGLLDGGMRMAT